ncbi:MAG: AAA family ATPase [Gaiellaceae bacterium]
MPCSVICVSHATGSGGDEVGRLVAEQLGFRHIDEEILATAAARGGISPADVADEERRKSLVARMLASISEGGSAMAIGGAFPVALDDEPNSNEIRALIREAIEQTAARGDVVITAHAASHALERGPRTLRVLVTASPGTRAQRVGEQTGVDVGEAKRAVKSADAGRRDYLKRFYDVAEELPTHYDLVVNTDEISVAAAAALVAHAADGQSALVEPA